MTSLRPIVTLAFGIAMLSGFDARASVERVDVPVAVRNGTGPVELACVYDVSEPDNYGLVVKWYHEDEQIYQWIPPMEPQELGVIAGLTSRTPNVTDRPQSHSIINVREATIDMSGEYTCIVATFYSEDFSEVKTMIVYVPEESLIIEASDFNETHVNLSCSAAGARPRPILTILTDSIVVDSRAAAEDDDYYGSPRLSMHRVTTKPTEPAVIECEIQIPGTGYGRRERLVYYPDGGRWSPKQAEYFNAALGLTSGAASKCHAGLFGLTLGILVVNCFGGSF